MVQVHSGKLAQLKKKQLEKKIEELKDGLEK